MACLLRKHIRASGVSLKAAVNEILRRGFAAPRAPLPPFEIHARPLGPPGTNYDCVAKLLEELDGSIWR